MKMLWQLLTEIFAKDTRPQHDVVECPLCQRGDTAICEDYNLAFPKEI